MQMVKRGGLHEMGQLLLLIAKERGDEALAAAAAETAAVLEAAGPAASEAAAKAAPLAAAIPAAASEAAPAPDAAMPAAASQAAPASLAAAPAAQAEPQSSVAATGNPTDAAAATGIVGSSSAPSQAAVQRQGSLEASGGFAGGIVGFNAPSMAAAGAPVLVSAQQLPSTPPRRPLGLPNGSASPNLTGEALSVLVTHCLLLALSLVPSHSSGISDCDDLRDAPCLMSPHPSRAPRCSHEPRLRMVVSSVLAADLHL